MISKLRKLLDYLLLEDMTNSFRLLQIKGKGYLYIVLSFKKIFINLLIKILKVVLY